MITQNQVLTGVWSWLDSDTTLRTLIGASGRVIKGMRRPTGMPNPTITVAFPIATTPYGWYAGSRMDRTLADGIMVNVYADNYPNGAMNVAQLDSLCARIHTIASQSKPTVSGASVHRLGSLSVAGPVYDNQSPNEAYTVMSFGYWLTPTT